MVVSSHINKSHLLKYHNNQVDRQAGRQAGKQVSRQLNLAFV